MIVSYVAGLPVGIHIDAEGTLTLSIDMSEADDVVYGGGLEIDGAEHEHLTDDALAHVQEALERIRHGLIITV